MKCENCKWWQHKYFSTAELADTGKHDLGECRRHAPHYHGFPIMGDTGYCGDFEERKNE